MASKIDKKKDRDYSKYYPIFFTIVFITILFQYPFSSLESFFYDLRIQYDWGVSFKDNIVLVTLDEESEEFLGDKYPYTYASHHRFFNRLLPDHPKLVGYFVNFQRPESESDFNYAREFKNTIREFKNAGGFFHFGTSMDPWGEFLPPQELQDLGYALALINIDNRTFSKDDVCRRAILNISGNNSFHLWAANHYREFLGLSRLEASKQKGGYYQRDADASFALFRYYTSPLNENGKISKIPFHRVVVGNFPKGFFTNKIVLVGPSYISHISDHSLTPFNKNEYKASKLMLHAQIIQALIQNKTVHELPRILSIILSIIIAITLSLIISKVSPVKGLIITLSVLLGILLLSYLLFSLFGYWLYMTYLILTICVVYYVSVPFRAVVEYQRRFAIQEETVLLKKIEDLKRNFISLMSHDLKTPVAKIAGIADILHKQYKADTNLSKSLTAISDSTKDLNKFITSILDLTKIESQNIIINKTSKDINTIIEAVVSELRYEATTANVIVETELSPLYPISMDIDLMKRVIANLLENAIKYSGANSKVVIKSWDDETWVYVDIIDNGVGIPSKDLDHVFDKFYRVRNDANHAIKGSGLGLYLVKYFVDLHGGSIRAKSSPGAGTTFSIQLKNA